MSAFLPAYKVNEVAVTLWALARLKGQPGLRLMAAALQHCFSQVGGTQQWWCDIQGIHRCWQTKHARWCLEGVSCG
jgi:hypothetical protein